MRTALKYGATLAIAVLVTAGGEARAAQSSEPLIRITCFHDPPVTISIVTASNRRTDVVVELRNTASQDVVYVEMVLAGVNCKAKTASPLLTYGQDVARERAARRQQRREAPIAPHMGAQIVVPGRMLDSVTSVSERTCRKRIPPELQVVYVRFRDGSNWDLDEEVRKNP
jgi:hypothetical protein